MRAAVKSLISIKLTLTYLMTTRIHPQMNKLLDWIITNLLNLNINRIMLLLNHLI